MSAEADQCPATPIEAQRKSSDRPGHSSCQAKRSEVTTREAEQATTDGPDGQGSERPERPANRWADRAKGTAAPLQGRQKQREGLKCKKNPMAEFLGAEGAICAGRA